MKKIIALFVCLSGLLYARSQAGNLDSFFAGKGWTYTDFGYATNVYDEEGKQVLLQQDGTYILVFQVNYGSTSLARYHNNSTLDSSFHGSGFSEVVQITLAKAALQSPNSSPVVPTLHDAMGRVLEMKQGLSANTTIQVGHNYRPGVYHAEAVQGSTKVTVKLLKQ